MLVWSLLLSQLVVVVAGASSTSSSASSSIIPSFLFLTILEGWYCTTSLAFTILPSSKQHLRKQQQQLALLRCSSPFGSISSTISDRKLSRSNVVHQTITMMTTTTSTSTTSSPVKSFRVVEGIEDIVADYDVYLLDMWGCMHDGIQPYDGVLETIQKMKKYNDADNNNNNNSKKIELIILSNSSKRQDSSIKMLQKLGFDPTDFAQIITSGEVAHHLLLAMASGCIVDEGDNDDDTTTLPSSSSWIPSDIPQPFKDLAIKKKQKEPSSLSVPKTAFCFGSGDDDEEYLNTAGWILADSIDTADLIVARGTFTVMDATKTVHKNIDGEDSYYQTYTDTLQRATQLRIPMIVCNPDKIRPDADKSPMPGTIGMMYEDLLRKSCYDNNNDTIVHDDPSSLVYSIGKPFPSVYEIALRDCRENNQLKSQRRACMVGDAIETDVTGANLAGIDSIWVVMDGIHNQAVIDEATSVEAQSDGDIESDNETTLLSRLQKGGVAVLQQFNQRSDETYAKGRQVQPTIVLPHFRW
jgi:ribonucleotide monophosphatase NagD (HAD superfamily)